MATETVNFVDFPDTNLRVRDLPGPEAPGNNWVVDPAMGVKFTIDLGRMQAGRFGELATGPGEDWHSPAWGIWFSSLYGHDDSKSHPASYLVVDLPEGRAASWFYLEISFSRRSIGPGLPTGDDDWAGPRGCIELYRNHGRQGLITSRTIAALGQESQLFDLPEVARELVIRSEHFAGLLEQLEYGWRKPLPHWWLPAGFENWLDPGNFPLYDHSIKLYEDMWRIHRAWLELWHDMWRLPRTWIEPAPPTKLPIDKPLAAERLVKRNDRHLTGAVN
jgi:hypothetical protein